MACTRFHAPDVVLPSTSSSETLTTPMPTPKPIPTPASPVPGSSAKYTLIEEFSGPQFFDRFHFETFDDPTHGYVNYVDHATAVQMGLISTPAAGSALISVESKQIASGRGRSAVRLTSNSVFTTGLFIIDVAHMPVGNGVWPAFWSFGPNWPNGGEIDVIEGVNNQAANFSTLHTSPNCAMTAVNVAATMTGTYNASRDCNDNNAYNGCSTQGAANSFGPGFNSNGGGVYAYLWTNDHISVWFWPRQQIPANITNGAPDPSAWGLPVSYFQLGAECSANHFTQHNLIINTTFCGDWAGAVFNGPTGAGSAACINYVQNNPAEFANAYWEIRSLRAYSLPK
jgi:hypothetical protein